MNKFIKYYFLSMAFAPLEAYILRAVYEQKVAIMTIYGNISVLLVCFLIIQKGRDKLAFPAGTFLLLFMAVYVSIWDLFNGNVDARGIVIILFRNYYLFTLTTLILIKNTSFSKKFIRTLVFLLSISVIPAFIVSLVQASIDPLFLTPDSYSLEIAANFGNIYEMRPPSIFGHLDLNEVGFSFVPILSLILGYRLRNKLNTIITIFLMLLGGFVCIATNARYVMLCFLIILIQPLFLRGIRFKNITAFLFLGIAGILVIFQLLVRFVGYDLAAFFQQRILSESAGSRLLSIAMFLKYFPDNPILGTGVRVTEQLFQDIQYQTSQIHIGYLSLLYEYGIAGGVFTFSLWYLLARDLSRTAKVNRFYGSILGFITFLVANIVLVQYHFYFYGLVFVFIISKHYFDESVLTRPLPNSAIMV